MSSLSASGARIQGDDYQHLFAWFQALRAAKLETDIIEIGIEDPTAGNVDDVTVYRSKERNEFFQIKYSVDARQLLNISWLTSPSKAGGFSILQRFYDSWRTLTYNGKPPKLGLITSRLVDPYDPVITLREGRDGTVSTRLSQHGPKSKAGKARKDLASHISIDESELLEFLGDLHFKAGVLYEDLENQASILMSSLGLLNDNAAVKIGVTTVRGWVTGGRRKLTIPEIKDEIASLGIQNNGPAAILLVQALDPDIMPENANIAIDWVDLFEGEEPRTRRQLRDNKLWNSKLRPEIRGAVLQIRAQGYRRVLVRGYMRLPTWFVIGVEFGKTAGFEVLSLHGGQNWASDVDELDLPLATMREETLGAGNELAIGASLATDLSEDVIVYLTSNVPTVGKYICIAPVVGPSNSAIRSASEARGWALNFRNLVRDLLRRHQPNKIHLFLASPAGAALLLGHRWDRMPDTQLYEDQGVSCGYLPSFFIPN